MKEIQNKLYLIIILLLVSVFYFYDNKELQNPTNISELFYFSNQTLNIILPNKECKYTAPATIYFQSELNDFINSNNYDIRKINLKDKNYFVTYYLNDFNNYPQFLELLKSNGIIRSKDIMGCSNLFFGYIKLIPSILNLSNGADLNIYQKVGGYAKGRKFFHKNSMYRAYKYKKNLFDEDFNYMPETFMYPEDKEEIENKFKDYKLNLNDLWLIKPVSLCRGKGIFIFNSLKDINMEKYVITKYISNISLLKERKYDLRLYVLISSFNPLRIYLYKEGLVRIAIEKFEIGINTISNKFMHITNTDLNIMNKKFIHPNNTNDENSNMWNLFMYKRYLKKKNIEWDEILVKIKDIIIKAIISISENLLKENDKLNLKAKNFYKILGIDILVKNDYNPILIEMNYYPEIRYYNNIDKNVKINLFVDALNIIGISPYSRKTLKPLNFNIRANDIENNINNAYCELQRPRGGFELIFPTKENIKKYNKFFENISFENNKLWEKIIKK